jgi:hypothetical protein
VERTTSVCRVAPAWECPGKFRSRTQAVGTSKAVKGQNEKGLGHFAGRRRRRSRNVASQVLLQRERGSELYCRFRSLPDQRADWEHACQGCRLTGVPTSGQTASVTITPTGGTAVTLTLTASSTTNTGTNFELSTAAGTAANLAAAINRNLSSTAVDRIVAVASAATVTVYALTPGNRVTLTTAENLASFSWAGVTAGTNGAQANIVAFNQLYSGSGTSLCNLSNPEFIFAYASGVGPVATSPGLSPTGAKITYVENDPNIGAIVDQRHDCGQRLHRGAGVEHLLRHAGDINDHLRNQCRILRG